MRKRQHPNDEDLLDLLDESPAVPEEDRAHTEAHLKECSMCTERLVEMREFVMVLRDANVWDRRVLKVRPRLEWVRQASTVAHQITEELKAAETEGTGVITGPSSWWRMRATQAPTTHTYGFVRKLLERADRFLGVTPASAVELTAIAVEIAEALSIDAYPFDVVISARAHASREYAYALFFIGRFPDALRAVDRAERLFEQLPVPDFELARARLVRALIYRSTDRIAEAIILARSAATVFRGYGAVDRFVKAKMIEGTMLYQQGSIPEALALWNSLQDEPTLREDAAFATLLQSIGTAHTQLGHPDLALDYLTRAIEEHERRGNSAERVRTRWSLASAVVATGRLDDALPLLRQTQREFEAVDSRSKCNTWCLAK